MGQKSNRFNYNQLEDYTITCSRRWNFNFCEHRNRPSPHKSKEIAKYVEKYDTKVLSTENPRRLGVDEPTNYKKIMEYKLAEDDFTTGLKKQQRN